jgi:hypothetical protein
MLCYDFLNGLVSGGKEKTTQNVSVHSLLSLVSSSPLSLVFSSLSLRLSPFSLSFPLSLSLFLQAVVQKEEGKKG